MIWRMKGVHSIDVALVHLMAPYLGVIAENDRPIDVAQVSIEHKKRAKLAAVLEAPYNQEPALRLLLLALFLAGPLLLFPRRLLFA